MTYRIALAPTAARQLRKFDPPVRRRVQAVLELLSETPRHLQRYNSLAGSASGGWGTGATFTTSSSRFLRRPWPWHAVLRMVTMTSISVEGTERRSQDLSPRLGLHREHE